MSEFDDFIAEVHLETRDTIGEETFAFTGSPLADDVTLNVKAMLNEVGTTEELTLNGRKISYDAVLQVAVSEFGASRPKAGQQVLRRKTGATYRVVGEVHKDTLTYTFPLATIHA